MTRRTPSVLDFARDELRAEPLTLRQVAAFLLGLALVLTFVVLWLSTGEVRPA